MKTPTILVLDDELFFRRLYADILGEDGYRIETVSSGREALERLRRGGVDLMLTDLVMPGISGLDVLRQARLLENPPEVILATGHATLETAIQALKNGARDYLIKPFQADELRHIVRTCLEQRRLLDENTQLKSQIRLFQRGQNLSSVLEIDRLLAQSVATMAQEIRSDRGFAFLISGDRAGRILAPEGVTEEEAAALVKTFLPKFRQMDEDRLLDVSRRETGMSAPKGVEQICFFPLRSEKQLKGGLVLLNPADGPFPSPPPLENLTFLAEQTALGFENACLYNGAKELIYTDDLTGLYNYRYLQMVLDREIQRAERYGLSFALVFIDLDRFKQINDTHGHLAGSSALKEVALLLRKSVREVDLLFRYGGDEFTALLVETDSSGAAVVSERIRQSIEKHLFLQDSDIDARLTATVGFATFPRDAETKRDIIDLADRAMYEGKKVRNVSCGAGKLKPQ